MSDLSFSELRVANTARNDEVFSPCNDWNPMEWACAIAEEAGEVCGAAKKMRRMVEGTNSAKDPDTEAEYLEKIEVELADVIIYCDHLARSLGIDLGQAVIKKFNIVSGRKNSTIFL